MSAYDLPTSIEIGGVDYEIRSDFRAVLDICAALQEPELSTAEKVYALLNILYVDADGIPQDRYLEAVRKAYRFIGLGEEDDGKNKHTKLMDWEQDARLVMPAINRVAGTEIRSVEHVHWWTFVGYYYEIGDCLFAQVVAVRDKLARGKKLEKYEREFYNRNRGLIDLKTTYSEAEKAIIASLNGGR